MTRDTAFAFLKIDFPANNRKIRFVRFSVKLTRAARIYIKCERTGRLYTKCLATFKFTLSNAVFCMMVWSSFSAMWTANFDTTTWIVAYHMAVPFDTTTVLGWYLRLAFQWILAMFYVFTKTPASTFYLSSCLYIEAMCRHFGHSIRALAALATDLPDTSDDKSGGADGDAFAGRSKARLIKEQLIETIALHAKILE